MHWLEEMARTLQSFKLAGNSNLPIQKMDYYVSNYLQYREKHYKILLILYGNAVAFKVLVTGALLILGTFLVVDRQITLGQFVASEIVIILIIGAVEKLILSTDVVYDVLTAVDKIGTVTDLPLERESGLKMFNRTTEKGLDLVLENVTFKYPESYENTLKGINLSVAAGEHICFAGPTDSGKNTLSKVITGYLDSYQGLVSFNGISMRSLNLQYLRSQIKKNVAVDDVFAGSILDNITMGKNTVSFDDVMWTLEKVGLLNFINQLPEGLYTEVVSGGKEFSESVLYRINLARCIISKPKLLIINDFFDDFERKEKIQLFDFLREPQHPWTLIVVSNDPLVLATCQRIILFKGGKIETEGSYQTLLTNSLFLDVIGVDADGNVSA